MPPGIEYRRKYLSPIWEIADAFDDILHTKKYPVSFRFDNFSEKYFFQDATGTYPEISAIVNSWNPKYDTSIINTNDTDDDDDDDDDTDTDVIKRRNAITVHCTNILKCNNKKYSEKEETITITTNANNQKYYDAYELIENIMDNEMHPENYLNMLKKYHGDNRSSIVY